MKIYLVYSFSNATPEWWKVINHKYVLVSADDVSKHLERALKSLKGLEVIVDSGGFRVISKGRRLSLETIIEVQKTLFEELNALPVVLDTPVPPSADESQVMAANRRTVGNAVTWQRIFGDYFLLPVHGLNAKQVVEAYRMARERLGSLHYIGLGSQALLSRRKPCKVVENVKALRNRHDGVLHVFGVGNSTLLALASTGVADSVDTSAPLRDANYGLARHPKTLSMAVVAPRRVRGRPRASPEEIARYCDCPICRANPSLLASWGRSGLMARAIHNAYQMLRIVNNGIHVAGELDNIRAFSRIAKCLEQSP